MVNAFLFTEFINFSHILYSYQLNEIVFVLILITTRMRTKVTVHAIQLIAISLHGYIAVYTVGITTADYANIKTPYMV